MTTSSAVTDVTYVRTPRQVRQFQELAERLQWQGTSVTAHAPTDRDFVREVLPPCFAPTDDARAMVKVGSYRTTEPGALETAFDVAGIYVSARFGDVEGWYHLTLLMTGDMPVSLGRELWGEAKKRGEISLDIHGDRVEGLGARGGTSLIGLSGTVTPGPAGQQAVSHSLNLKVQVDFAGRQTQAAPVATIATVTTQVLECSDGQGTVELRSSADDPCGTVPLGAIDRFVLERTDVRYAYSDHVLPADDYLPYVLGRSFDSRPHA